MYFRVNTQKNKDGSVRKYLLLSRTYRVDGKVRQETLCNLGRLEQLTEGGSVDSLIEGLAKFSERYLDRIHGQGSSNTVTIKWTREFGPVYLFKKIWEKLGLGRLLRKLMDDAEVASRYDEAIFAMVLNRLMDPNSKYAIFRKWVQTVHAEGLSDIQLHHYYRALDFLAERKEQIEGQLYGQLTDLMSLDVDLVFYDTTSTYFEGTRPTKRLPTMGTQRTTVVTANRWIVNTKLDSFYEVSLFVLFRPIASMRRTISAISLRGTVASSKIVVGRSRASADKAVRRA